MTKISEDDKSGRQDVPKISSPSGADSLAQEGPLENLDKLQISPTTNAPASSDDVVPPHRSHDPQSSLKRSDPFQFGSRYLLENDDVFEFNAWDHVEMDQDYIDYAESQLEKQREKPVSDIDRRRFNGDPAKWWNLFYKNNTTNFFKDRKWLQQEFPILSAVTQAGAPAATIVELGAGAGNTAFPIIANNQNPRLRLHALDFSKKAVELMRADPRYDEGVMRADVWDVAACTSSSDSGAPQGESNVSIDDTNNDPSLPPGLAAGSADIVLLIFVFSALAPTQWRQAVRNVHRLLRPGGEVLLRDYARGDLVQVRFRKGRYLEENFYIRGDGTRVYFFDQEELARIWTQVLDEPDGESSPGVDGDDKIEEQPRNREADLVDRSRESHDGDESKDASDMPCPSSSSPLQESSTTIPPSSTCPPNIAPVQPRPSKQGFETVKLDLDKRLLVNRQRRLKMYRCWIQGRFKKVGAVEDSGIDGANSGATKDEREKKQ